MLTTLGGAWERSGRLEQVRRAAFQCVCCLCSLIALCLACQAVACMNQASTSAAEASHGEPTRLVAHTRSELARLLVLMGRSEQAQTCAYQVR